MNVTLPVGDPEPGGDQGGIAPERLPVVADEHGRLAAHRIHDAGADDQRAEESQDLLVEVREREHGEQAVRLVERHDVPFASESTR